MPHKKDDWLIFVNNNVADQPDAIKTVKMNDVVDVHAGTPTASFPIEPRHDISNNLTF